MIEVVISSNLQPKLYLWSLDQSYLLNISFMVFWRQSKSNMFKMKAIFLPKSSPPSSMSHPCE